MKPTKLFLLLGSFLVVITSLSAFPVDKTSLEEAVMKHKTDGTQIVVQPLIVGEVGLFRQPYHQEEIDFLGGVSRVVRFHYFIGTEQIEQISPDNYRFLIKKYLKDAEELHQKLGRAGFRYENIPSMVMYYNRFNSERPMVLKYDLRTTSALLMEN